MRQFCFLRFKFANKIIMDNLEFDMGKSSLASGPLSHKFGRSLSKNVEETYLNILRAVFMFVVML